MPATTSYWWTHRSSRARWPRRCWRRPEPTSPPWPAPRGRPAMSPSSDATAGPGPRAADQELSRADGGPGDAAVEVTVVLPADLHARPAGRVVQVTAGLAATVDIRCGDKSASTRSVL